MLDIHLDDVGEGNHDIADHLEPIINELLTGSGAVVFRNLLPVQEVDEARRLILSYSEEQPRETHFHGANSDTLELQRRVWNLLNKGAVFERIVQHPVIAQVASSFLGNRFILGSIAANRLLPGGPGQEPHVDYPYWDLYEREGFPVGINSSFPMNLQVTYPLDPFTAESGASAWLPGTQHDLRYPGVEDRDRFYDECARMLGQPGDAFVFNGMVWHCAMPNESEDDRSAVLVEYLPKFITPLEDQRSGVRQEVVDRATPLLRQLMGFDYPYPKLFDEAEAEVQIGRDVLSGD